MTVKKAVDLSVCSLYHAAIFRRISREHDETTLDGFMKNRELVRLVWKSTKDDECPPLDDEIANAEIEDQFSILPISDSYAFTIKEVEP